MNKLLCTAYCLLITNLVMAEQPATHKELVGWLTPPEGQQTIGDSHGDIAVANDGRVYISVMGEPSGLQIYSADG